MCQRNAVLGARLTEEPSPFYQTVDLCPSIIDMNCNIRAQSTPSLYPFTKPVVSSTIQTKPAPVVSGISISIPAFSIPPPPAPPPLPPPPISTFSCDRPQCTDSAVNSVVETLLYGQGQARGQLQGPEEEESTDDEYTDASDLESDDSMQYCATSRPSEDRKTLPYTLRRSWFHRLFGLLSRLL